MSYNKPYSCCDDPVLNETKSYSTLEKLCYLIEKVKGYGEELLIFVGLLDAKEDSINITLNRKLSENGDFTGTLCGDKTACEVNWEIDNNQQQINFLVNQFDEGATGLVVECGYFGDDEIDRSYDGGVW